MPGQKVPAAGFEPAAIGLEALRQPPASTDSRDGAGALNSHGWDRASWPCSSTASTSCPRWTPAHAPTGARPDSCTPRLPR